MDHFKCSRQRQFGLATRSVSVLLALSLVFQPTSTSLLHANTSSLSSNSGSNQNPGVDPLDPTQPTNSHTNTNPPPDSLANTSSISNPTDPTYDYSSTSDYTYTSTGYYDANGTYVPPSTSTPSATYATTGYYDSNGTYITYTYTTTGYYDSNGTYIPYTTTGYYNSDGTYVPPPTTNTATGYYTADGTYVTPSTSMRPATYATTGYYDSEGTFIPSTGITDPDLITSSPAGYYTTDGKYEPPPPDTAYPPSSYTSTGTDTDDDTTTYYYDSPEYAYKDLNGDGEITETELASAYLAQYPDWQDRNSFMNGLIKAVQEMLWFAREKGYEVNGAAYNDLFQTTWDASTDDLHFSIDLTTRNITIGSVTYKWNHIEAGYIPSSRAKSFFNHPDMLRLLRMDFDQDGRFGANDIGILRSITSPSSSPSSSSPGTDPYDYTTTYYYEPPEVDKDLNGDGEITETELVKAYRNQYPDGETWESLNELRKALQEVLSSAKKRGYEVDDAVFEDLFQTTWDASKDDLPFSIDLTTRNITIGNVTYEWSDIKSGKIQSMRALFLFSDSGMLRLLQRDFNQDGRFGANDIDILRSIISKKRDPRNNPEHFTDLDGDGKITAWDGALSLRERYGEDNPNGRNFTRPYLLTWYSYLRDAAKGLEFSQLLNLFEDIDFTDIKKINDSWTPLSESIPFSFDLASGTVAFGNTVVTKEQYEASGSQLFGIASLVLRGWLVSGKRSFLDVTGDGIIDASDFEILSEVTKSPLTRDPSQLSFNPILSFEDPDSGDTDVFDGRVGGDARGQDPFFDISIDRPFEEFKLTFGLKRIRNDETLFANALTRLADLIDLLEAELAQEAAEGAAEEAVMSEGAPKLTQVLDFEKLQALMRQLNSLFNANHQNTLVSLRAYYQHLIELLKNFVAKHPTLTFDIQQLIMKLVQSQWFKSDASEEEVDEEVVAEETVVQMEEVDAVTKKIGLMVQDESLEIETRRELSELHEKQVELHEKHVSPLQQQYEKKTEDVLSAFLEGARRLLPEKRTLHMTDQGATVEIVFRPIS